MVLRDGLPRLMTSFSLRVPQGATVAVQSEEIYRRFERPRPRLTNSAGAAKSEPRINGNLIENKRTLRAGGW